VFATGYFVHAITIVVLVMLCGYMARLIRRQIVSDEAGHARRPQFSLGSMLVWTAIVAIGLGVGTTSFAGVRLPPNFFSHFVPTQCLSAGLDAGFAVLLLWSLVGPWRWVFPKVVLGLAIIACGVYLSRFLFGLIDPIYLYPPVVETGRVLKGFYVATLCLTLVPLRLAGYFGVEKRDLHAPRSRLGRDNPSIC
jgi:multisubunit Na+/H+ antiporter MnhC subunit